MAASCYCCSYKIWTWIIIINGSVLTCRKIQNSLTDGSTTWNIFDIDAIPSVSYLAFASVTKIDLALKSAEILFLLECLF